MLPNRSGRNGIHIKFDIKFMFLSSLTVKSTVTAVFAMCLPLSTQHSFHNVYLQISIILTINKAYFSSGINFF
jgi:hypothetical protein